MQRGAVDVDGATAGSLADVLAIGERFADLPFDLADASVAETAGRRKIRHVLGIDADFDVYRDRSGQAFVSALRTEAASAAALRGIARQADVRIEREPDRSI